MSQQIIQIIDANTIGYVFNNFDQAVIGSSGTAAQVNDTLVQTRTGQMLVGGNGNDTLTGWGASILDGGSGDDTIFHYGGNSGGLLSRVSAGDGNDSVNVSGFVRDAVLDIQITAGRGQDVLVLHTGDYRVFVGGDLEKDVVSMAANGGAYTISSFDLGIDQAFFRGSGQTFVTQKGSDALLTYSAGDSTAILVGFNAATVAASTGFSLI